MSTVKSRRAAMQTQAPSTRPPTMRQIDGDSPIFVTLGAVWGAAIPMLGAVPFGAVGDAAANWTAWLAFGLGALALITFLLHDPTTRLGLAWQVLWTVSFVGFLLQLASTPRIGGEALSSELLLVALWAVSLGLAWFRPQIIWPHGVLFLLLSGSAIAAMVRDRGRLSIIFPVLFCAAIVVAGVIRLYNLRTKINAEMSERKNRWDPLPPAITPALVVQQVLRDAGGKETQSAATYSYLWLADQFGHVGLGLILGFLFTWAAGRWSTSPMQAQVIGFAVTTVGVSGHELIQYLLAVRSNGGPFKPDLALTRKNAVVAALYMVIGATAAWAFQVEEDQYRVPMLVALMFVAIVSAKFWVRQKIIWQKAGLPYLFRLAEAQHDVLEETAKKLLSLIQSAGPPDVDPQQVLIAGPVGSGRTMLASGIGTEFAFTEKTVRYLSFDHLIEFADTNPPDDDPGPANISYWPWMQAQVLILDDIGPVLGSAPEQQFERLLNGTLGKLAPHMRRRHTVWVLGDVGTGEDGSARIDRFARLIHAYCGRPPETALTVRLQPGKQPDVHRS